MKDIRLIRNFETRSEWHNIFQVLKERMSTMSNPAKLSFRYEGEVKTLSDEGKQRELATNRLTFKA